ncbi:cryptochrome/photolyase family protein [Candidatus Binatia bacterium]|jgi:deoxyribodipyrimidine photolyase-related protein|nr:cryptochrome/photolyase family protein [Candidatus Binatia bacterium]
MANTVWILGDQLTADHAALRGCDRGDTCVLLIESQARARRLPYHKQKLVLVWSAMRHFASELRAAGWTVDFHAESPTYRAALDAHVRRFRPARLRLMDPAEAGAGERLAATARAASISDVTLVANDMFLSDEPSFARWAAGRKTLRLETFYRDMRRRTGLLMEGRAPAGGRWNFDADNRAVPPPGHVFPAIPRFAPDAETRRVMRLVEREFGDHFGTLDGFAWPVTRADAERFRDDFLDHRLDLFGPYEDAMVRGQRALYHSLLSPLLNLGLLAPLDLCRAAEERWRQGRARLQSVEGFVRQILGWREFVLRVYRHDMPDYARRNALAADLPLPRFYWDADTDMACVREAVATLAAHGVNHHIQRLMITGNFALLAGIDPQQVNEWYWLAYADAYEWVVTPNVLGLSLWADGGRIASKPYAAAASYVNRMSDHCRSCAYDHRAAVGARACPFNALYWDFLARNRERLARNPRMQIPLASLARRPAADLAAIRERAAELRARLRRGERL